MQVGHFSAAAFPYEWVTFRLSKTPGQPLEQKYVPRLFVVGRCCGRYRFRGQAGAECVRPANQPGGWYSHLFPTTYAERDKFFRGLLGEGEDRHT